MIAQQGHLYQFHQARVLAMQSGSCLVRVRMLIEDGWGLSDVKRVNSDKLTPLPMRYFHGQTPK